MSYNWKKILLKPEQPIRDALQLIDKESLRIALVIDDNCYLLGVVTDGDIRRGLLNNLSIDSPVNLVMNKKPITAEYGTSRKELIDLMASEKLLSIPLLDAGVVAGVEALQYLEKQPTRENPVFFMAGGFGKRLRPLTDSCPKPMLKVGDKPILEWLLKRFIRSGFKNFYISTHYLPEIIRDHFGDGSKWGVSICYVHEDMPLGTGGALGLLPENIPDLPLILINGDVLTNMNFEKFIQFHNKHNAAATMCVRDYEYQVPYGVIAGDGYKNYQHDRKNQYSSFLSMRVFIS